MWGPGFNVSRELLLAVRQSNQQRVLHLVEGLVGALRQQREAKAAWSAETFGTSLWDFACAVQRLSRLPLGEHEKAFWTEVTHVIRQTQVSLQPRELALFCNALASSPTVEPAQLLLKRAVELQAEMTAKDLQMVLHGLSHCANGEHPGFPDQASRESLAATVLKVRLDKDHPVQAAQLLAAFVRLRHDNDAVLSKHLFDHAVDTLPGCDVQSLTVLCTAIAGSRRVARASIELAEGSEEAWQAIVSRLVELLPKAKSWQLASLARALKKVGASPSSVEPFYDGMEQLLTSTDRSDSFSPADLTFVVNGLAQQRCLQLRRPDAETMSLDRQPLTSWAFEEQIGRKLHAFTSSELAVVLHAAMRLRRGGPDFFDMVLPKLLESKDLTAKQLAHSFSASAAAGLFLADLTRPMRLLRQLLPACAMLGPSLTPWSPRAIPLAGRRPGFCNSRCSLCSRKGGAPHMTCDAVLHATALAVAPAVLRIVEVGREFSFRVSCRQNQAGNLRQWMMEVYPVQWKKRLQSRAETSDLCFRAFPEVVKDEQKCYEIREMLRRSGMDPASQNRLVQMLQTAAHPVTCVFHAAFKIVVILIYIYGRYIHSAYVSTFILCTIFAALDFWTVKNISGRLLVGLRWWNLVKDDGSSEWVFESNPDEGNLNATDRNIFWGVTYIWPLLWAIFLFMNILNFSLDWVLLNIMIFIFAGTNLAGYWKCSTDAKKRAQQWVESQGMRAVAGAMGFA
ncbi:unnamed protein product [Symbiodinium sp. CCMP2592]|nr:unnamed protein product [Symbiodinium sp. CCMP2592]